MPLVRMTSGDPGERAMIHLPDITQHARDQRDCDPSRAWLHRRTHAGRAPTLFAFAHGGVVRVKLV